MNSKLTKILRKLSAGVVIASVLVSANFMNAKSVKADEQMESAAEAVSHMNVGWNLGNTLDSYGTWINGTSPASFEAAWGNVVTTKAMIDSVRAQGINSIRIPVTWAQHIDDNGNIDAAWLNRVKEVVDYAYDEGMYVILNVHHDTGENGSDKVCWIMAENDNYAANNAKFRNLWTNIANAFIDYDDHLLFEGYNEIIDRDNTWNAPNSEDSYQATNDYAQAFVDAVRATGGNNATRNIIINTYVSSIDPAVLSHMVFPTDTTSGHMICEVHVYSPWGFTGTAASVNWTPVHNDFTDADRNEIDGIMIALENFSNERGLPVIIGEFGAEYKNNDDQIANYVQYLVSSAASHGVKCFYWDNGIYGTGSSEGGYAIFNRQTLEWKTNIVQAMVGASVCEVTAANTPAPTPVEETTEATAEETTTAATTTEETTTTVAETTIEETTATETTIAAETEVTSESSSNKGSKTPIIVGGVVVLIAASYVGLYFLGKSKRK